MSGNEYTVRVSNTIYALRSATEIANANMSIRYRIAGFVSHFDRGFPFMFRWLGLRQNATGHECDKCKTDESFHNHLRFPNVTISSKSG
jgi:hypothetical protein